MYVYIHTYNIQTYIRTYVQYIDTYILCTVYIHTPEATVAPPTYVRTHACDPAHLQQEVALSQSRLVCTGASVHLGHVLQSRDMHGRAEGLLGQG